MCILVQHWACVWSRSPAPQTRPPPSPLPFGASRSARSSLLPGELFTTEMAAKVCRSVLLLSRSSGAAAGCLPALVVSSQRRHQHIRPVSPRTVRAPPTTRGREVRGDRAGRRAGPGGEGEAESGAGGGASAGLAKEVKLTSLKDFSPFMSCSSPAERWGAGMSHEANLVPCGCINTQRDVELSHG